MMKFAHVGCIVAFIVLFQGVVVAQSNEDPNPNRFEGEITAFQQWDLKNSFPKEAVLFVGSSSIRFWNTAKAFPDYPVINRGFGGSHISDVQHYYEQVIAKYDPSVIVFYAGDNDVAADKPVSQVVGDYKELVNQVMDDFPDAIFAYVSIKPSGSRWEYWESMKTTNQKVQAYNEEHAQLFYVDLATPLLVEEGRPNNEYFIDDQLHLNEAGYKVWNDIMGKKLKYFLSESKE